MEGDGVVPRPGGRETLVLVAVLAVALAGCTGLVPGDSVWGDGPGSENASRPANLDHGEVVERHRQALREAGTFNATETISLASNSSGMAGGFSLTYEYAVDLDRDRAIRRSSTLGETVRYTAGNTTYERSTVGGTEPIYEVTNHSEDSGGLFSVSPVNVTEAIGAVYVPVDAVEFRYVGEGSFEGTTVKRYEASGTDAVGSLATLLGSGNATEAAEGSGLVLDAVDAGLQSFSATMLVDREGVVRLVEWELTLSDGDLGLRSTIAVRHVVTDVGTATVEPPGWLDEARERSTPVSGPTDCQNSTIEGSFDQRPAENGTYDVTFEVTSMRAGASLTLEYPDVGFENLSERTTFREGVTVVAPEVEPGTTVRAVAENRCDETLTVATHTVTEGGNESEREGRLPGIGPAP